MNKWQEMALSQKKKKGFSFLKFSSSFNQPERSKNKSASISVAVVTQ